MLHRLSLLLICCLFIKAGVAQQAVKATVFENKTRVALAGIRVQNLRSKKYAVTDNKGEFRIDVIKNDLLVLTGFAYQADTILLVDLKPREIFLEPQGTLLKEVDIKNGNIDGKGWQFYNPDFHGQTVTKQFNRDGSYKGGAAFRIWSNNSEEKKRAKESKLVYDNIVNQDIDKVFNEASVSKYLPLTPAELSGFIVLYMPSVKTYTSKNFNLLLYIDSCYKEFAKLPPEKRLAPKLKL